MKGSGPDGERIQGMLGASVVINGKASSRKVIMWNTDAFTLLHFSRLSFVSASKCRSIGSARGRCVGEGRHLAQVPYACIIHFASLCSSYHKPASHKARDKLSRHLFLDFILRSPASTMTSKQDLDIERFERICRSLDVLWISICKMVTTHYSIQGSSASQRSCIL